MLHLVFLKGFMLVEVFHQFECLPETEFGVQGSTVDDLSCFDLKDDGLLWRDPNIGFFFSHPQLRWRGLVLTHFEVSRYLEHFKISRSQAGVSLEQTVCSNWDVIELTFCISSKSSCFEYPEPTLATDLTTVASSSRTPRRKWVTPRARPLPQYPPITNRSHWSIRSLLYKARYGH